MPTPPSQHTHQARLVSWSVARTPTEMSRTHCDHGAQKRKRSCASTTTRKSTRLASSYRPLPARHWNKFEWHAGSVVALILRLPAWYQVFFLLLLFCLDTSIPKRWKNRDMVMEWVFLSSEFLQYSYEVSASGWSGCEGLCFLEIQFQGASLATGDRNEHTPTHKESPSL